ncbi:MAG: SDR family NAD(P)-dependent oxidoreductase [Rhodothermales bacterium]
MKAEFKGKVVFITGGASGIGKATAMAFAKAGARVVVADLNDAGGEEVIQHILALGNQALFVHTDVADPDSVKSAVGEAIDRLGCIDIAFNNAGIGGLETPTSDYPESNWHQVISVNLSGVFYCMKHQLAHMIQRRQGVVINMASVAGLRGFPWHAAYAASKHGVIGLTKTAAVEVAKEGIRVNAICPGFTETPMVELMIEDQPGRKAKLEKGMPIGRMAHPDEIAEAVLFLASSKNKFMIGHSMVLDGGISST